MKALRMRGIAGAPAAKGISGRWKSIVAVLVVMATLLGGVTAFGASDEGEWRRTRLVADLETVEYTYGKYGVSELQIEAFHQVPISSRMVFKYDDQGTIIGTTSYTVADEEFESVAESEFSYEKNGVIVRVVGTTFCEDPTQYIDVENLRGVELYTEGGYSDGDLALWHYKEYNRHGDIVRDAEYRYGTEFSASEYEYEYDGDRIIERTERHYSWRELFFKTIAQYDDQGRIKSEKQYSVRDGKEELSGEHEYKYFYDKYGNLIRTAVYEKGKENPYSQTEYEYSRTSAQALAGESYQSLIKKIEKYNSKVRKPLESEMLDQPVINYVRGSNPNSPSGGMYLCANTTTDVIKTLKPHTPVTVLAVRGSYEKRTGHAFVETEDGEYGWIAFKATKGIGLSETNDF